MYNTQVVRQKRLPGMEVEESTFLLPMGQPPSMPLQLESFVQSKRVKQMHLKQLLLEKKEATYPKVVTISDALSILQALEP